jgi:predicted DNA-binding transcriptional regulator AlpA
MSRFLDVKEVADLLGIAVSTVWKLVGEGVLPAPSRVVPGAPRWWLDDIVAAAKAAQARPTLRRPGRPWKLGAAPPAA